MQFKKEEIEATTLYALIKRDISIFNSFFLYITLEELLTKYCITGFLVSEVIIYILLNWKLFIIF